MAVDRKDFFLIKVFTGFIACFFLVLILRELRQIFIPIFIAVLLYFLCNGLVRRLVGWGVPKALVLIFLVILIFVLCYSFGLLIYTGTASFINDFPAFFDRLTLMAKDLLFKLKIPLKSFTRFIETIDWKTALNPSQLTSILSATLGSFTAFLGNLLLIVFVLVFMLASKRSMVERMATTLSAGRSKKLSTIVSSIEAKVQHYLWIKTLLSLATALLAAVILLLGRFDFVIFLSLMVFLFNYIPTFGSIISTAFALLVGLASYGFSLRVLVVVLALMAMNFILGNAVEPLVMGKNLNLSPILILFALVFSGWLWGIVGMFLAVPLLAALRIILEHIDPLKPIAAMMGDD